MKLEHFGLAGPGDCRVVFSATGPELAQAVEECRTAAPELSKENLLTEAVNLGDPGRFSGAVCAAGGPAGAYPAERPGLWAAGSKRGDGVSGGGRVFLPAAAGAGALHRFCAGHPAPPHPEADAGAGRLTGTMAMQTVRQTRRANRSCAPRQPASSMPSAVRRPRPWPGRSC